MLSGRNILCISVPPWKGEYAATIVELMKRFGEQNQVLYVQNPFTIKDLFTALLKRRPFPYRQALGLASRIRTIPTANGAVHVMIPPVLLTNNFLPAGLVYNITARINGWLLVRSVRRQLRRLGMQSKLIQVVAFNPVLGMFTAGAFDESLLL